MSSPPVTANPLNQKLLAYRTSRHPEAPAWAPRDAAPDPYMGSGAHPDVVARLWDEIGAQLPVDCRCLIQGSPALCHPRTGLVFGLAMGTQYALFLPGELAQLAIAAGAKITTVWGLKEWFDLATTCGDGWVFGCWSAQEPEWCRQVCEAEAAA